MNTSPINFFTPIIHNTTEGPVSFLDRCKELPDRYFYLWGKIATKLPTAIGNNNQSVTLVKGKQKWIWAALKISTYLIPFVFAPMLVAKILLRQGKSFKAVDLTTLSQMENDQFIGGAPKALGREVKSSYWLKPSDMQSTSNIAALTLSNENKLFFKSWKDENGDALAGYREIAATRLSHYLTEGKVPLAHEGIFEGHRGNFYPFVQMDISPFQENLKVDKSNGTIDFSFLDEKAIYQLFVHILTDRLISNWDTHNGQFGFDIHGNVISFDKEMAFEGVFLRNAKGGKMPKKPSKRTKKEPLHLLALDKNYWRFSSEEMAHFIQPYYLINQEFVRQIKEGQIKIDCNHPELRAFFTRCGNLSEKDIRAFCSIYAKKGFPGKEEEFYTLMKKRIYSLESACASFFEWPEVKSQPKNRAWGELVSERNLFSSIQSIDQDLHKNYNVYPVTNEINVEKVQEQLRKVPTPTNSLHIGFSGYHNFDIAYQRKSDYILCLDMSNGTDAFYKATEDLIAKANDRLDFVNLLVQEIDRDMQKYYPMPSFNHRTVLSSDLQQTLLSKGWLSNDASFLWIKEKYAQKQVQFLRANITDVQTFKKLCAFIKDYSLKIDTLYIANIFDWLAWEALGIHDFAGKQNRQPILDAFYNIKNLISKKTQVIDATNKTGMSAASQFLVSGKEFDPITYREKDGNIQLPHLV